MAKSVFFFGDGVAEGAALGRELLGGKGFGLAEMTSLGVPVPPGFTISTEQCARYYAAGMQLDDELKAEVREAMGKVERAMNRRFGDPVAPLLVSVRSGARDSMPGMMDTILNLGMNDEVCDGLAKASGNRRFALDSYRRFIQMFSDVALGIEADLFEQQLHILKHERNAALDTDLAADDLAELIKRYRRVVSEHLGDGFPTSPWQQLWLAVGAVFRSWHNDRAALYRKLNNIPEEWGTAVNVQAMVFGNLGDDSATGVGFTRNPATGEKYFYGEFLINAQGEDVVAGIRTPQAANHHMDTHGLPTLEELMPARYNELLDFATRLETHRRDMQDIEFTIERGKLFLLQTRNGKRSGQAAMQIALDLLDEGVIDTQTAVKRVSPDHVNQLLHKRVDPKASTTTLGRGLNASPGAVTGHIVFNAEDAVAWHRNGRKVVLVRTETSPEDLKGMHVSEGILTARGGRTSHAAVVARGMGKACVAGCADLVIDEQAQVAVIGSARLREGDVITLDGNEGRVLEGSAPLIEPDLGGSFSRLLQLAGDVGGLPVRANADDPESASRAREFGASGIGLCRTEHMFQDFDRILAMREMILAETTQGRERALEKILPMQRNDFVGIFRAMSGLPVTIRLLDWPLHEFLPHEEKDIIAVAHELGVSVATVRARNLALHEANPMLGHRAVRLGLTYPEIYAMQVRAIFEAAITAKSQGFDPHPEIMIPLVSEKNEMVEARKIVEQVAREVISMKCDCTWKFGTMIETPRAALVAHELAEVSDFFSFGTNDLTQTTYGFSRDDCGALIGSYVERGILAKDPFVTIDENGVGALMRMAVENGRRVNPKLKVGICGEHGADPASVAFASRLGVDYVSCSPFRVPVARVAAAHGKLNEPSLR